jgi:hypothetical protein
MNKKQAIKGIKCIYRIFGNNSLLYGEYDYVCEKYNKAIY